MCCACYGSAGGCDEPAPQGAAVGDAQPQVAQAHRAAAAAALHRVWQGGAARYALGSWAPHRRGARWTANAGEYWPRSLSMQSIEWRKARRDDKQFSAFPAERLSSMVMSAALAQRLSALAFTVQLCLELIDSDSRATSCRNAGCAGVSVASRSSMPASCLPCLSTAGTSVSAGQRCSSMTDRSPVEVGEAPR